MRPTVVCLAHSMMSGNVTGLWTVVRSEQINAMLRTGVCSTRADTH